MKLIKMKLEKFRQFIDDEILFAIDPIKKVTFVEAPNGAGKSTLMQAILWCLYGESTFEDYNLLSSKFNYGVVKVNLFIEHSSVRYEITRFIEYTSESQKKNLQRGRMFVTYKNSNGNIIRLEEEKETNKLVQSILPKQLNRNFFFDGERLEKMSQDIVSTKVDDFRDSVERLLGLSSLLNAMKHLKLGSSKQTNYTAQYSVIGRLTKNADTNASDEVKDLTDRIESIHRLHLDVQKEFDKYEGLVDETDKDLKKQEDELRSYSTVENDIKLKNQKEKELSKLRIYKRDYREDIISIFRNEIYDFTASSLVAKCLSILRSTDNIDIGVPDVQERTIQYILKKGKCICGTDVSDLDSIYVKNLKELINFIPPKSLGNMIEDFKSESLRMSSEVALAPKLRKKFRDISGIDDSIRDLECDITELENNLSKSERRTIADLQEGITKRRLNLMQYSSNVGKFGNLIQQYEDEINELEKKRTSLREKVAKNTTDLEYLAYANEIFDTISNEYRDKEKSVRQNLMKLMNSYFSQIVRGVRLDITEKYSVATFPKLEYSTGERNSIIFSYVLAILKMASEKQEDRSNEDEIFPLVMDAPFSSLDSERKTAIGRLLVEEVDQIIIFDKDPQDRKYFRDSIGADYTLSVINEKTETKILKGVS